MLTMRVSFHPLNFIKLRKQRWFKGKKEKEKKSIHTPHSFLDNFTQGRREKGGKEEEILQQTPYLAGKYCFHSQYIQ